MNPKKTIRSSQGPNGVGKSLLAAGLCHHALQSGYRAYFRTMDQIMTTLKTKDISRSAIADYKKLYKAHLIVIDDIMMIAIARHLILTKCHLYFQLDLL